MIIIGVVGAFGSGCTFVADIIANTYGYTKISLSDVLKKEYAVEYGKAHTSREQLQDFGNTKRSLNGSDYFAARAWEEISKEENGQYVIDSIRNPAEIEFFHKTGNKFFLFGIFADSDIRWERVKQRYDDNRKEFKSDDKKDSGDDEPEYGQRVSQCFFSSDIIIRNNTELGDAGADLRDFEGKIRKYLDFICGKDKFIPTPMETFMTMAYANSLRSSCLKRKVGALIVDEIGNVFSSGYNEVPLAQRPCMSEYEDCYRDKLKRDFKNNISFLGEEADGVYETFKNTFKILDYCRALHAEESAILNVARNGVSNALTNATIYSTTYPCNLCANKIAHAGINELVYFEPYPMDEAKKILTRNKVEQTPFEGVTYNGYFRFEEV